MKKMIFIMTAIIIAAASISFGLTYSKQPNTVAATGNVVQVDLLGDHAEPSVVSVEKGQYVQFNTKDNKRHDIGQGRGESVTHPTHSDVGHEHAFEAKQSGVFGGDEAYKVQFKETGTFTFHDHLNPTISIVVVVYEPDSQSK